MRALLLVCWLGCSACGSSSNPGVAGSGGAPGGEGGAGGVPASQEPEPEPAMPPEISLSPRDGATGVELEPTLVFSFSKPMDRASVEAALRFEPEVEHDELSWAEDGTALECPITAPLEPETTVTVTLGGTASALDGASLERTWSSTFTTRSRPKLVSTSPEEGAVVPDLGGSVVLVFGESDTMDEASLERAFRFVAPAGHPVTEADCFFERCTIRTSEPFEERQEVTWELSTEATDTSGVAVGETTTGSFTTGRRTTLTLEALAALDGTVTEAGGVDASGDLLTVGRSGGSASRALLSFDLSSLPAELLAFSRATLTLQHQGSSGSTESFGLLLVTSLDYGASLTASAFDAPIHTYETCNLLWQCENEAFDAGLSASAGAVWSAPVSDLVRRDLDEGSPRSQMRIAFASDKVTTTNGTETFASADAAAPSRPRLELEYWEP